MESAIFQIKVQKYLDSSEKHFSRKNDRSSSKTDCVGLGEEKCLRDPRGSRMGKEKGKQNGLGAGRRGSWKQKMSERPKPTRK